MVEPGTSLLIFDRILNVIGLISGGRVKRDDKIESSLRALYTALEETKAYVVSLNDGQPKNRDKESNLANLWHRASIPLRHIDKELARICFLKGGYWLEPETWDEARIETMRHRLRDIVCVCHYFWDRYSHILPSFLRKSLETRPKTHSPVQYYPVKMLNR